MPKDDNAPKRRKQVDESPRYPKRERKAFAGKDAGYQRALELERTAKQARAEEEEEEEDDDDEEEDEDEDDEDTGDEEDEEEDAEDTPRYARRERKTYNKDAGYYRACALHKKKGADAAEQPSTPTGSPSSTPRRVAKPGRNSLKRLRRSSRVDDGLHPVSKYRRDEETTPGREQNDHQLAPVLTEAIDENVDWQSIGGMSTGINNVKECVVFPLVYPGMFSSLGIECPKGMLFHGPPGTGKTLMVRCLAGSLKKAGLNVTLFIRKGADILSKFIGEAEQQLRQLFDQAKKLEPSIIFFDEIDGLAPVRSAKNDQVHTCIVATLLALMDGLENRGRVVVIGATNRPDAVDPALRRPGRFDREIAFSVPSAAERFDILKVHTAKWPCAPLPETLKKVADKLVGYSGADLQAICNEAGLAAFRRIFPQIYEEDKPLGIDVRDVRVCERDFNQSVAQLKPSGARVSRNPERALQPNWHELFAPQIEKLVEELRSFSSDAFRVLYCRETTEEAMVTRYVAPAALHQLGLPVFTLNAGVEAQDCNALGQQINSAIERAPAVLYLPRLDNWEKSAELSPFLRHLQNHIQEVAADCKIVFFVTDFRPTGAKRTGNDLGFDGALDEISFPVPTEECVVKFWSKFLNMRFRSLISEAWEKQAAVRAKQTKFEVQPLGPAKMPSNSSRLNAIDWDRTNESEMKEMEKEEEVSFTRFREHVKYVIDSLSVHAQFQKFDNVDALTSVQKEYQTSALTSEPLFLTHMKDKNLAKEYEHEMEVEADFKKIGENWEKFSTAKGRSSREVKLEKQFVDMALLLLLDDRESVNIISDWTQMRERRDSRRAWRERKAEKQAPVAPTIRQSNRLAGLNARMDGEYGPDEFTSGILAKLTHAARTLKDEVTLPIDFSTTGLSKRMREIEVNTSGTLEGMDDFIEDLFRTRQEHHVFSKLTAKPCYNSLQEVCKQFCAAAAGSD